MKYRIVLFVILFPVFASAQRNQHYFDSLAENVFKDLQESWTLGIDSNSSTIDIRVYNKFKSLFDSSATVSDDFNAFYIPDLKNNSGTYKIDDTIKTFDLYAHDIALQVSKLRIDIYDISKDLTSPANITFKIKRNVYAEKMRQYVMGGTEKFVNSLLEKRKGIEFVDGEGDINMVRNNLIGLISRQDTAVYQFAAENTLLITMAFSNDTVKIKSIETTGEKKINCLNDLDADAILNWEDSMPKKPGDFTANGRPDYDLDAVPDEIAKGDRLIKDECKTTYGNTNNHGCPNSYFITQMQVEGYLGLQYSSAKINLPELNQLGYDNVDVLQSKKGVLKNPGLRPGIYAGGNFTYYFGHKKRQSGISIGITYSKFTAQYELAEPIIYTFKSSDGTDNFRRQVTISSLKEEVGYNIFSIPVLYTFRWYMGNRSKWTYNIKAGPSFMIFKNTSNYNARIDVGGIYQSDANGIVYNDQFDPASTWNIYVTSAGINSQNTNPGAENVFSHLNSRSYDFVSNKNYLDRKTGLTRTTVAFNLAFDLQNKISDELALKIGTSFIYAPLKERKEKYRPLGKTTDEFNSVYNSTAKSTYSAFGVNVGFVYNF